MNRDQVLERSDWLNVVNAAQSNEAIRPTVDRFPFNLIAISCVSFQVMDEQPFNYLQQSSFD